MASVIPMPRKHPPRRSLLRAGRRGTGEEHTMQLPQLLTPHLAAWAEGGRDAPMQTPAATYPSDLVNSPGPKTTLHKRARTDSRILWLSIKIQSQYEPQEEKLWLEDHVW